LNEIDEQLELIPLLGQARQAECPERAGVLTDSRLGEWRSSEMVEVREQDGMSQAVDSGGPKSGWWNGNVVELEHHQWPGVSNLTDIAH
jgi:hypothetical protein